MICHDLTKKNHFDFMGLKDNLKGCHGDVAIKKNEDLHMDLELV